MFHSSNSLDKVIESSTRGGFFLVSGNILANLILAASLLITARLLGSDQYGLYRLSLILPSLLILFVDLGVDTALIRFTAGLSVKREEKRAADIIRHAFFFKAIVSLSIFVISFTFADYFAAYLLNRPGTGLYIRLALLVVPFHVIFNTVNSTFIGLDHMSSVAFITNLEAASKVLISTCLILLAFGVSGAIIGYVVSFMIAGILGSLILFFRHYRKLYVINKNNGERSYFKDTLKTLIFYGFPLYTSTLIAGLIPQYQGIVLAFFTSNWEIGNFGAAANLLTLVTMISLPITTTLFPAFSKLDPKGKDVKKFFQISVKYTTLLILPVAILVLIFSREIVHIAYGSTYALAPLFLSVYCTLHLFAGLGSLILGSFFNGTGNTLITFKMALVDLAIILPLTPLLALLYGVIGLIIAHLISSFCATFYGLNLVISRFKIKLFPKMLFKIYVTSIIAAIPVLILLRVSHLWWVWNTILGITIYLSLLLTLIPLSEILQTSELQKIDILLERIPFLEKILRPITSYEKKINKIVTKNKA